MSPAPRQHTTKPNANDMKNKKTRLPSIANVRAAIAKATGGAA